MSGIRPNKEQFIELMNAPDEGPVVMLNLLKFKPRVARKNTARQKVINEMMLNTSACFMNGMSRWMRKNSI